MNIFHKTTVTTMLVAVTLLSSSSVAMAKLPPQARSFGTLIAEQARRKDLAIERLVKLLHANGYKGNRANLHFYVNHDYLPTETTLDEMLKADLAGIIGVEEGTLRTAWGQDVEARKVANDDEFGLPQLIAQGKENRKARGELYSNAKIAEELSSDEYTVYKSYFRKVINGRVPKQTTMEKLLGTGLANIFHITEADVWEAWKTTVIAKGLEDHHDYSIDIIPTSTLPSKQQKVASATDTAEFVPTENTSLSREANELQQRQQQLQHEEQKIATLQQELQHKQKEVIKLQQQVEEQRAEFTAQQEALRAETDALHAEARTELETAMADAQVSWDDIKAYEKTSTNYIATAIEATEDMTWEEMDKLLEGALTAHRDGKTVLDDAALTEICSNYTVLYRCGGVEKALAVERVLAAHAQLVEKIGSDAWLTDNKRQWLEAAQGR